MHLSLRLAVLSAALFAAPASAESCVWKEPKGPPKFEVDRFDGAKLTFSFDPSWFHCAKKSGGKLELVFSAGAGDKLTPVSTSEQDSYAGNESVFVRDVCKSGPGPKKVQATLTGKGPMARLSYTSEVGEMYCQRCEFASDDNMFVMQTRGGALTPQGTFTIEGTLDENWFKCARAGSTLELWLFAAETRLEAKEMKDPTHKIPGLEAQHYKKTFSRDPICKTHPKYVGYELHGTGEFQRLNNQGRAYEEINCEK